MDGCIVFPPTLLCHLEASPVSFFEPGGAAIRLCLIVLLSLETLSDCLALTCYIEVLFRSDKGSCSFSVFYLPGGGPYILHFVPFILHSSRGCLQHLHLRHPLRFHEECIAALLRLNEGYIDVLLRPDKGSCSLSVFFLQEVDRMCRLDGYCRMCRLWMILNALLCRVLHVR